MTENGWIPTNKKLPEQDERYKGRKVINVLVTTDDGYVTKVQRHMRNNYWAWGRIYGEPTAWQPLPSPYRPAPEQDNPSGSWQEQMASTFLGDSRL